MGIAELIVALCLQAEPGACRIVHRQQPAPISGCAIIEEPEELTPPPGYYLARWTCRWRG